MARGSARGSDVNILGYAFQSHLILVSDLDPGQKYRVPLRARHLLKLGMRRWLKEGSRRQPFIQGSPYSFR